MVVLHVHRSTQNINNLFLNRSFFFIFKKDGSRNLKSYIIMKIMRRGGHKMLPSESRNSFAEAPPVVQLLELLDDDLAPLPDEVTYTKEDVEFIPAGSFEVDVSSLRLSAMRPSGARPSSSERRWDPPSSEKIESWSNLFTCRRNSIIFSV